MPTLPIPAVLATAGLALAAYPALRPWGDSDPEGGPAVAAAFADWRWPVSHALGMVGFVLVAVALRRLAPRAGAWVWAGAALVLPYYGAEAFGLHALGRYAVRTGDVGVLTVADDFRFAALPLTAFGLGLLALAVAGALVWRRWWGSGPIAGAGAVLVGAGLVAYLPQYFAPPAGRVAHGLLLGLGLALLAATGRPAVDGLPAGTSEAGRPSTVEWA